MSKTPSLYPKKQIPNGQGRPREAKMSRAGSGQNMAQVASAISNRATCLYLRIPEDRLSPSSIMLNQAMEGVTLSHKTKEKPQLLDLGIFLLNSGLAFPSLH